MRIVVSGGGTAGHITPILATVDALKSLDSSTEFLYIGMSRSMEAKIAASLGMPFRAIPAGKFRRVQNPEHRGWPSVSDAWLNFRDVFRVMGGIWQSIWILREFKPDVIFIKGGYVGLPVGIAAGWLKIPYVIHESDIHLGLTNRILARKAARIAVGFPANKYKELPKEKLIFTGNPVRREVLQAHPLEGRGGFGLEDDVPVILVMGGSQGAKAINDAVIEALPELVQKYQLIHVTGEGEIERVRFRVKRLQLSKPDRYHVYSFLVKEMGPALASADVVISRAGANTIAELAAMEKPTILIPNYLMAGHQVTNAVALARAGAARMIPEQKLNTKVLLKELDRILSSKDEQKYLAEKIREFAVIEADRELARVVREVGGRGEE